MMFSSIISSAMSAGGRGASGGALLTSSRLSPLSLLSLLSLVLSLTPMMGAQGGAHAQAVEQEPLEVKLTLPPQELPQKTPSEAEREPFFELRVAVGEFTLINHAPLPLIDLKRGAQRLSELPPGSRWEADEQPLSDLFGEPLPPQLSARFKLEDWGEALHGTLPTPPREPSREKEPSRELTSASQPTSPALPSSQAQRAPSAAALLASVHLKTAGFRAPAQEVAALEQTGAPSVEEEIAALRWASPQLVASWAKLDHPLALALTAYAARYAPPLLLKGLLARFEPNERPSALERWRAEGYEALPPTRESLRVAFERHGARALSALLPFKSWSEERGFDDPLLALALMDEGSLLAALTEREDGSKEALAERLQRATSRALDQLYADFLSAQKEGDPTARQGVMLKRALDITTRLKRSQQRAPVSLIAQALCGTLDSAAKRSLSRRQLLATEALVTLSAQVCHGVDFSMSRASELMALRGEALYFEGDFEGAQRWFRAGLMLKDEPLNRIRFIDALSQLALRANASGEVKRARRLIDEARSWDSTALPHRALLALADELMPRVDHRARLGLLLLIGVLSVIVSLRLLRLFHDDTTSSS